MKQKTDRLIMGSEISDGVRVFVRKNKDDEISCGTLELTKEGKPVDGEIVKLSEVSDSVYDVESIYKSPGPSKVASKKYKDGWDRIFGNKDVN